MRAPSTATLRTAVAVAAGVAVAAAGLLVGVSRLAPLAGWDSAGLIYVAWTWLALRRIDAETSSRLARRESPGRAVADGLLLAASVASLAAVGSVLLEAASAGGAAKALLIGLGVISVVLSWAVVHTVFALRYARLYYDGDPQGGIDFNDGEPPTFRDFAYVAFTVGMTFQVSDTEITSREMRGMVLRQALLSYLFGAVIIAVTINLVAGLSG